MTQNKHFKALVRTRVVKTGESYSIARSQILGTLKAISPQVIAEFKAHDKHATTVSFVPGRPELVSGGFSGQARIWSTSDWAMVGELVGHTASVNAFGISGDGKRAITASSDKTVRLWNLAERQELAILGHHSKPVVAVDLSTDGALAATGSYDGNVRLWSIADQSELSRARIGERVASVAFHPYKPWLAVANVTSDIAIIGHEGNVVSSVSTTSPVSAAGWSGDGEFLIGVGGDQIRLWSGDDWDEVRSIKVDAKWITSYASNRDSSLIAIGWDHHVSLWRVDNDEPVAAIDGLPKGVYGLDFSPDGKLLGLGCADGRVRVWAL